MVFFMTDDVNHFIPPPWWSVEFSSLSNVQLVRKYMVFSPSLLR